MHNLSRFGLWNEDYTLPKRVVQLRYSSREHFQSQVTEKPFMSHLVKSISELNSETSTDADNPPPGRS